MRDVVSTLIQCQFAVWVTCIMTMKVLIMFSRYLIILQVLFEKQQQGSGPGSGCPEEEEQGAGGRSGAAEERCAGH